MNGRYLMAAAIAVALAVPGAAEQQTGAIARDFKLNDANGRVVQLSSFRGKPVVLEWTNADCPFVKKHYDSGNMQRAQAKAREMGAVWLTINSGAPGKQGHLTGAQAKALVAAKGAAPTAYLLDPKGIVGKGYAAKTTPHMYVIDASGKLVFQGGIDDKPTADKADIATARNHVLAALEDLKAGKPVAVAEARPYGCSVKYSDAA
jgi:peroxiredoxin